MNVRKHFAARVVLAAVVLFATNFTLQGQWLWPVEGAKAGENLLLVPQQYLDSELNFDDLVIAAPAGTKVYAPADGEIKFLSIGIYTSLASTYTTHFTQGSFDSAIEDNRAKFRNMPVKAHFLQGCVGITLDDGRKIYISGLRGNVELKTGMMVKRGDVLGEVSYCYHKISEPSILMSVSTPDGKPADPMTPFGLKTTFREAGKLVIPQHLTAEQANEDFTVLMDAYKECYPSLDEIVSEEQFAAFNSKYREAMKDGISYADFYNVVRASMSAELVHDSHIGLLSTNPGLGKGNDIYVPHLMLGILGDSVMVTKAERSCAGFVGKRIESIDGESAAEIVARVERMMLGYDGDNRSHRDNLKLTAWNYIYGNSVVGERITNVKFTDGTEYKDVWMKYNKIQYVPFTTLKVSYIKNQYMSRTKSYDFRRLNDSTVLFSLHSFVLSQVEMESIADSLKSFSNVPYMVIDVRNNPGGDVRIINQLVSYFMDKPTQKMESYLKVNKNGKYESFKYAMNYVPDYEIFSEYKAVEGKDGFYAPSDYYAAPVQPDSLVHYGGKLYLLTDETSISAATMFPALLVRNRRAVTVGRETLSGYHYMTAYKFLNLMLPNSKIQVRIPLVKDVFDDLVTARTPKGRGLIPDYEVPLSYEEVYTSEKDIILEKALELISEGKYLGEDCFQEGGSGEGDGNLLTYVAVGTALAGCAWLVAMRSRRHR